MFRYYEVCSWQSYAHYVNLPTLEASGLWEGILWEQPAEPSRCLCMLNTITSQGWAERGGGLAQISCVSVEKLVTSRHRIFLCSFAAQVQKDAGKKARAQLLLYSTFQVLLNTTQWPVSRGISSVNRVLSNCVTFSETNLGYQPVVLFWPRTCFS